MPTLMIAASNVTAATEFLPEQNETHAYRRFGGGAAHPLVFLQHFMGTLDNWDPAVTDILATGREVIRVRQRGYRTLKRQGPRDNSGHGGTCTGFPGCARPRSRGFSCFSLGGTVAQEIALARPSRVRRMLAGTAPEAGEEIMHIENPELKKIFASNLPASQRLVKLFFAPTASGQAAGEAFVARLGQRNQDREPVSGPDVPKAQIAAFRAWEGFRAERFAKLHRISQPCLVVRGVFDILIPVGNSYLLSEHLPNAVLLTYPDAGHGSLFQFHESFMRQAPAFLAADSQFAP